MCSTTDVSLQSRDPRWVERSHIPRSHCKPVQSEFKPRSVCPHSTLSFPTGNSVGAGKGQRGSLLQQPNSAFLFVPGKHISSFWWEVPSKNMSRLLAASSAGELFYNQRDPCSLFLPATEKSHQSPSESPPHSPGSPWSLRCLLGRGKGCHLVVKAMQCCHLLFWEGSARQLPLGAGYSR